MAHTVVRVHGRHDNSGWLLRTKGKIMPYKIRLGNMSVQCDTADEVRELMRTSTKGQKTTHTRARRDPGEISSGMETLIWEFLCSTDSDPNGTTEHDIIVLLESKDWSSTSARPALSSLKKKGYAVKLRNGNWKATTP